MRLTNFYFSFSSVSTLTAGNTTAIAAGALQQVSFDSYEYCTNDKDRSRLLDLGAVRSVADCTMVLGTAPLLPVLLAPSSTDA